jgi:hypothetical protein
VNSVADLGVCDALGVWASLPSKLLFGDLSRVSSRVLSRENPSRESIWSNASVRELEDALEELEYSIAADSDPDDFDRFNRFASSNLSSNLTGATAAISGEC